MARDTTRLACFHGGDLADAAALRVDDGAAPQSWVDISTGINPFTFPVGEIEPPIWNSLPSRAQLETLNELARKAYGADKNIICVAAPGSQAFIRRIPQMIHGKKIAILGPTYAEHALCWGACDHEVDEITALDQCNETHDILVLTRPNNPGGEIADLAELERLCSQMSARDGVVIVDEAFADGLDISLLPHLSKRDFADCNIVVLRSLGKFYGLAGARVGFALGQGPLISALSAQLGPWPVAGPSLEAAIRALEDEDWRTKMADRLIEQRAKLVSLFEGLGLASTGEALLFQTVKTPLADALFRHLIQDYIYVRRFSWDRELLRFGLPGPAEDMWRLEDSLKKFAQDHSLQSQSLKESARAEGNL